MATDRSYPVDSIGNEIRKGDLVHVRLADPSLVFTVIEVQAAGTILSPDGQPLALNGMIVVAAQIPVPFAPGSRMPTMHVLRSPSSLERAISEPSLADVTGSGSRKQ